MMKVSFSSKNTGQDTVAIELVGTLGYYAGKREFDLTIQGATTITALIKKMVRENDILRGILTEDGGARDLLILVNGREISVLDGLATRVRGGDRLTLLPVSHGG